MPSPTAIGSAGPAQSADPASLSPQPGTPTPPASTAAPATATAPAATSTTPAPLAWSEVAIVGDGPRPREDHTLTVVGDRALLFGGRDGSRVFDDLWSLDLATRRWEQLDPEGERPAARFGHEAVAVAGLGLVVYAGQAGPTTFFGDLWAFNPATGRWTELPATGARPVPRYGSCMAVASDGRLVISHGFTEDGTRFSDTRAYDITTGRWADLTPGDPLPVARCLHGCWFVPDGRLVLYAGQTTGVAALGDLWALAGIGTAGASWSRVDDERPADRNRYARVQVDDGSVLVFGGQGIDRGVLDDLLVIDPGSLAARELDVDGIRPAGRFGAELVHDPAGRRLLLFGGTDGRDAFADLWSIEWPG
ncbi:MAG TPA: kelch repeat-containing protein [Candidatus Limnocylindrales bacterium]|nr:kelch repeat-containing protein [Candidatus Limnocylindrales bacterium]